MCGVHINRLCLQDYISLAHLKGNTIVALARATRDTRLTLTNCSTDNTQQQKKEKRNSNSHPLLNRNRQQSTLTPRPICFSLVERTKRCRACTYIYFLQHTVMSHCGFHGYCTHRITEAVARALCTGPNVFLSGQLANSPWRSLGV